MLECNVRENLRVDWQSVNFHPSDLCLSFVDREKDIFLIIQNREAYQHFLTCKIVASIFNTRGTKFCLVQIREIVIS